MTPDETPSLRIFSDREKLALKLASLVLYWVGGERIAAQVAAGLMKLHHREIPPDLQGKVGYVRPPDRVP